MPLTPETLPRHELDGLHVRVVDAANPDLVGISGRVVLETEGTLRVESAPPTAECPDADGESRVRQVPKRGTTFEFALTDEAADAREGAGITSKLDADATASGAAAGAGNRETDAVEPSGEGVTYVTVDGARLLSRPATRTETTSDSKWR